MIVWSVNDELEMKWEGSGPGLIDVIFLGGEEARNVPRETLVSVPNEFRTGNVPNTNFERCHYRKLPGKCCDIDNMHIQNRSKLRFMYILFPFFVLFFVYVHTYHT